MIRLPVPLVLRAAASALCVGLLPGIAVADASGAAGAPATVPGDAPADGHDCLIEPMTLTELGSPVQGVVERVLVERGETVTEGQPLVELESSVERAMLEQAEARADMQSEVHAREAELELAGLDLARVEDLNARDLASERERDEATARRQIAAAGLVQALENRRLLQLELQRMQREVARRTLRSSVDGIVVEWLATRGELVNDNPVARIAQLDPLRVEVVLPGRLIDGVHRGLGATVHPELGPGTPLAATVDIVDPMLDARSGTFGVRLALANADLAIRAGQRCRVVFDAVAPAIPAARP